MIINRKDIVTGSVVSRDKLIRISVDKNGVTIIDYKQNQGGRGIYILPSSIEKGLRKNIILKQIKKFGGNIESILEILNKEEKNGQKK